MQKKNIYKFWQRNYDDISCLLPLFDKEEHLIVNHPWSLLDLEPFRYSKKRVARSTMIALVSVSEYYAGAMIK